MMTDDEIIRVVTAHKEGKKIQVKDLRIKGSEWKDTIITNWFFDVCDYRVKRTNLDVANQLMRDAFITGNTFDETDCPIPYHGGRECPEGISNCDECRKWWNDEYKEAKT